MLTPFMVGMAYARAGYEPAHSANSLWHGMNLVRSGAKLYRRTRGATEAGSHQVRAINPLRWDKRTRGVSKFMRVIATDHTSQDSVAIISPTDPESTILLGSVARGVLFDPERLSHACSDICVSGSVADPDDGVGDRQADRGVEQKSCDTEKKKGDVQVSSRAPWAPSQ